MQSSTCLGQVAFWETSLKAKVNRVELFQSTSILVVIKDGTKLNLLSLSYFEIGFR